jgi:hypothetical protein
MRWSRPASNLDPDEVLMSATFWQMGNTNAIRPAWRHDPALEQQVGLYAFHGPDDGDQEASGLFLDIPAPVTDPGGGLQRAATGRAAAPADSSRAQDRARRQHERVARGRLGKR